MSSRTLAQDRLPGEELAKDRIDMSRSSDAPHLEIRPFPVDGVVGAPERCPVLGRAENVAFPFIDDLDIGEILAKAHELAVEEFYAALGIGGEVVAVGSLGGVDIPFSDRIALLDDAVHFLERRGYDGAAALRVIEERVFVHLLGLVGMANDDDLGALIASLQEQ